VSSDHPPRSAVCRATTVRPATRPEAVGRGFSLVEVMVAAAVLGLIATAVVQTLGFVARSNNDARVRTTAAVEAKATLDRIALMRAGARSVGADAAQVCALLEAADGPMDATNRGGTASGTCPYRKVANIPTGQPGLRRTVEISEEPFGRATGLRVTVTVGLASGTQLSTGNGVASVSGVLRP
jgi:prepilin-type N-terminal cleavage/methylation domain-containing protein